MFELRVYYHDVLRYMVIGNLDKAQDLRKQGFYVQVKVVPGQSNNWAGDHPEHFRSVDDDVIVYHDGGFGVHEMAGVRPEAEHHIIGF